MVHVRLRRGHRQPRHRAAHQSVLWWGEMDGGNWNDPMQSPVHNDRWRLRQRAGSAIADYQCQPSSEQRDSGHQRAPPPPSPCAKWARGVLPDGGPTRGQLRRRPSPTTFAFTHAACLDLSRQRSRSLFTSRCTRTSLSALSLLQHDLTFTPRAVALESTWGAVTTGWVQVSTPPSIWSAVCCLLFNALRVHHDPQRHRPLAVRRRNGLLLAGRPSRWATPPPGRDSTTCRWP